MEADAARHAANYAQKERLAATANAIERDKLKLAQNPYGGVSQNGGDESTDTEIVAYAELEKQATAERLAALKRKIYAKSWHRWKSYDWSSDAKYITTV